MALLRPGMCTHTNVPEVGKRLLRWSCLNGLTETKSEQDTRVDVEGVRLKSFQLKCSLL